MSRIYFIRHGETEWNAESRLQGQLDIRLSEFGESQAKALGKHLEKEKFHEIFSSPLLRAAETAEALNTTGKPIHYHTELSEIFLGKWQGLTVEEVRNQFPEEYRLFKEEPEKYESVDMETLKEIGERFHQFLLRIKDIPDKQFMVVSHGTVMRAGLAMVLFGNIKFMNQLVFENGSISVVDFHEYNGEFTPVIYKLNDTSHFEKELQKNTSSAILMGVI